MKEIKRREGNGETGMILVYDKIFKKINKTNHVTTKRCTSGNGWETNGNGWEAGTNRWKIKIIIDLKLILIQSPCGCHCVKMGRLWKMGRHGQFFYIKRNAKLPFKRF